MIHMFLIILGLTSFLGRLVCSNFLSVFRSVLTVSLAESPIQPKGPRVPESPYGAQSLRGHPGRVNGIFSGCSRWFVEHVAVIRISSYLPCSVTYFLTILYCLATLAPGAQSFGVRSPYTAYALSICGSYFSIALGIYRPPPNFNAGHFFSPICDTSGTIVPFQYPCIAIACSQVAHDVDVTTSSFTFHGPVASGAYCCDVQALCPWSCRATTGTSRPY